MIGNHNSKNKLMHGVGIYERGRLDSKTPEYRLWCSLVRMGADAIHPDFVRFQTFGEWVLSHHVRWVHPDGTAINVRLCNVFCVDGKPGPDSIPMPKDLAFLLNNPNTPQCKIMPVLEQCQQLLNNYLYNKILEHTLTRRKGRCVQQKPG